jgi:hypothetical protein
MHKIKPINPLNKKMVFIILITVYFIYFIIGLIFKTDILNAVTFRRNGMSISFIGILLLIFTTLLIGYIIEIIGKRIGKTKI